ncbi:sensor histidine kinase [Gracilibacillus phocaeensis]|uniref:sensor histidine kinase n=1 Tax=Gracilibacillus phocaeensis TaxID=2042304 RepID=UPI001032786B|nr:HAMP domain-containing sensor histidine kinase [Gracilibacillus phocaeensis]
MKRFLRSLFAKYLLFIFIALFLVYAAYLVIVCSFLLLTEDEKLAQEESFEQLEEEWHQAASQVEETSAESIQQIFADWQKEYPEAAMFWINGDGVLTAEHNLNEDIPLEWDAGYTVRFIKDHYDNDPFTVVAFLGEGESDGFVVFQLPRQVLHSPAQTVTERYGWASIFLTFGVVILFLILFFWFFRGIRKRLVQLEEAMAIRDTDGLPILIEVKKQDEIGDLEKSFNQMVKELRESKQREQEEEQLRRELIANLSHDLRTPLTKINAQAFTLEKQNLPAEAQRSIQLVEKSIRDIDKLIENLMSYTLLMASKYQKEVEEVDIIRHVRQCLATWYSVFERKGFTIDMEIEPFSQKKWEIDPLWFSRILDNLLQNVLRHAGDGKYVSVSTESTVAYDAFVISDRGKGMQMNSNQQGAGIGLSIVDMMVKGMGLDWKIDSSERGTTIRIIKYR